VSERPSTWLSPEEVEELTGLKRWKAQCRMLSQMGVPFRPNGFGRPLVERAAVLKVPRGKAA
jgi:hypothetical protein